MIQFAGFLEQYGFTDVATCPTPLMEYTNKRVLTMTKLNGVPLIDTNAVKEYTHIVKPDVRAECSAVWCVYAFWRCSPTLLFCFVSFSCVHTTPPCITPQQAIANAINVWSTSVVNCGFFHADVHGGNLLLLDDGRVGFIDFGIVGRLPPKVWGAVTGMNVAVAEGDYAKIAQSLAGAS